jgi:hypothetical protein
LAGSGAELSRQVHPGHFSGQIDDRLEAPNGASRDCHRAIRRVSFLYPTAANDAEARKSLAESLILICPPQASDLTALAQLAEHKKRRTQRAMQAVVEDLANPRMKLRSLVHRFHVSTGISR